MTFMFEKKVRVCMCGGGGCGGNEIGSNEYICTFYILFYNF